MFNVILATIYKLNSLFSPYIESDYLIYDLRDNLNSFRSPSSIYPDFKAYMYKLSLAIKQNGKTVVDQNREGIMAEFSAINTFIKSRRSSTEIFK